MPVGFGRNNGFPFRFGGGPSALEDEHLSLLDALAKGWDTSENDGVRQEAYAQAQLLSCMWAMSKRLANQALPLRMLENLTTWEEATGLRPSVRSTPQERRRLLAAKLRGYAGNAIADLIETCTTVFGSNFVECRFADPADHIVYWPGGLTLPSGWSAPGPPGFEWSTNRVWMAVEVTKTGLSDREYLTKRNELFRALDTQMPAWMAVTIGVGSSFVVNVGIVGETFI